MYVAVRRTEATSARPAGSATAPSIHSAAVCPAHCAVLGGAEPGDRSQQPAPLADAAAEMGEPGDDAVVDHERGAVQLRHATSGAHAELGEHLAPAPRPVQGVRTEVEVEAVAPSRPGPAAEVLGALQHGDRASGPDQRGGSREPGEATADDDRVRFVHAIETIDRRPL